MAFQPKRVVQVWVLLSIFIGGSTAGKNISMEFTTKPKYAEYLVGTEVVFEWKYSSSPADSVKEIQFGYSLVDEGSDVAIIVKNPSTQEIRLNPSSAGNGRISSLKKRLSVVENKNATFKIVNLTLNDTGTYFCAIRGARGSDVDDTEYVKLTVVDIMMDPNRTTDVIESWEGHKIHLKCAVKVPTPAPEVWFSWKQGRDRRTLIGRQVNRKDLSQITIVTKTFSEYEPVTCTARTAASTQQSNITIKWLRKPSRPQKVTIHELRNNDTKCVVYNRIAWSPPRDDGGSPITGYAIEYKHPVLNRVWESPTNTLEHVICKVQSSGHPRVLNVTIRGMNKIGRGDRSIPELVPFLSTPSAPKNLTTLLERKEQRPPQVVLTWKPPDENGGSPIVQYSVQYKSLGSSWRDAHIKTTNKTQSLIVRSGRDVHLIYEVRVSASNSFGTGALSEVTNATFAEKPGAPEDLAKHSSFYDDRDRPSVKVDWNPPDDEGGSMVTHYLVEFKTVKTEWLAAKAVKVETTNFAFEVKKSETYTVRVSATNRVGTGKPSNVISVKFSEKDNKETLARSHGWRLSLSSSVLITMLSLFYGFLELLRFDIASLKCW